MLSDLVDQFCANVEELDPTADLAYKSRVKQLVMKLAKDAAEPFGRSAPALHG